jgi:hypothetical protein
MSQQQGNPTEKSPLNEDWLAVAIAFILIVLSAIGLLGKTGINITF